MKLGFTAAISLIALLAASIAVTASPLERRATQRSNAESSQAQAVKTQSVKTQSVKTQFVNAQSSNAESIANLQRTNTVTIAGAVVQVQGEAFVLRDGTGEMLVEAEFPAIRQANLKAGDRVTVAGQYDDESFEAFSITPANGSAIYVFDD